MPIRVTCSCGKTLAVKDALAGKAVKCPACQQVVRIPAAKSASGPSPSTRSGSRPAAKGPASGASPRPTPAGELDDLFAEEGFGQRVGATCPACAAEMKPGAVLCTRCGFNTQTGQKLAAHRTESERTLLGHKSLDKAAADMESEQALQEKLKGAGFPWWILALLLFLIVSAAAVGVMTVNYALAEEGADAASFNPLQTFLMLTAVAFYVTAVGASIMLIVRGFQESVVQGLLVWFVPFYVFYFVATRWSVTWRPFVLNIVAGILAGICVALMAMV